MNKASFIPTAVVLTHDKYYNNGTALLDGPVASRLWVGIESKYTTSG